MKRSAPTLTATKSAIVGCVTGAVLAIAAILVLNALGLPGSVRLSCVWVEDHCLIIPRSNADHGDTLAAVAQGISQESCEYFAVFHGEEKLFELTSGSNRKVGWYATRFPDTMEPIVCIHNHPILDASFSYDDLKLPQSLGSDEMIVVTAEMAYSLRPQESWPDDAALTDYFQSRYGVSFEPDGLWEPDHTDRLYEMAMDGYVQATMDDNGHTLHIAFKSKLIADLAAELGLIYTEMPLEDFCG